MQPAALTVLDRRIIHALWIAPRASWRELAGAIGTTDQTVARRYRALCAEAGLRIIARLDEEPLGWDSWLVRLQCTPDAPLPLPRPPLLGQTPPGCVWRRWHRGDLRHSDADRPRT